MSIRTINCQCCGEEFQGNHTRKYAPGHTPSNSEQQRTVVSRKYEDAISASDFNELLLRAKREQNLTWEDIAYITGRKLGTISSFGRSGKKWVTRELAEDVIKRLAGHAKVPTPRQEAEYTSLRRKDQSQQRAIALRANKLEDKRAIVEKLRQQLG